MISTNPGEDMKPLAKIASGGELSRIMLAIKSVMAETDVSKTLILMRLMQESAERRHSLLQRS